jgi:hypothetical protein
MQEKLKNSEKEQTEKFNQANQEVDIKIKKQI